MRVLLLSALALATLPAAAQTQREERRIVVTVDSTSDGPAVRFFGTDGAGRGGERVIVRRMERDGRVEADTMRFRFPEGLFDQMSGMLEGPLREAFPTPGVSDATRDRMRTLDERSRDLARQARAATGRDRDRLVRDLDGVLAELFDARADARREEAAHLRERADALEAGLRDRDARREALLDARRRELLGETDGAGW